MTYKLECCRTYKSNSFILLKINPFASGYVLIYKNDILRLIAIRSAEINVQGCRLVRTLCLEILGKDTCC